MAEKTELVHKVIEAAWPHLWKLVPKHAPALVGSLAVASIAVAIYYGVQNALPAVQPRDWLQLIIFVLAAELILFVSLYFCVRKRGHRNPITIPVLGLVAPNPDGTTKKTAADLLDTNARREGDEDLVVQLTSATVLDGLRRLHGTLAPSEGFALCIGINPTGLALAKVLAKEFDVPRENVGVVLTSRKDVHGHRSSLWALPNNAACSGHWEQNGKFVGKILLVDSEFKSGNTAKEAIEHLAKEFACDPQQIWYVALVACGVTRQTIQECGSLKLSDILKARLVLPGQPPNTDVIPHRVAYFTPGYVEMPYGIP